MNDFSPHIFRIQRYSIHDGPGIRTTLFFQGCPLRCAWCHNPESQPMKGSFPPENGNGRPVDQNAPGPVMNPASLAEEIIREVEKDLVFYDTSGGGVTFSGGEPLCRPDLLMALLEICRDRDIHTCLDTSGFAPFRVLEPAARAADLVLYDVKHINEAEHKRLTGHTCGKILDNLARLSELEIPVRLRFPLIPSMTDTPENIDGIIAFLASRTRYREIHLLPFHNSGEGKYRQLNMKNKAGRIRPPDPEHVKAVARQFEQCGFAVTIGG